jgi:pyocin large subunit-like protein
MRTRLFSTSVVLIAILLCEGCTQFQPTSPPANQPQSVRSNIGFASQQKLLEHFEKHGAEFGSITINEYLSQAQTMRDRTPGGSLLEFKRADGVTTRYDRDTGAFIAFDSDGTIRTYFRPNAGERYFERQRYRD